MQGFVALTDQGWYRFLRGRPHLREVNFWRPGSGPFKALRPGEPFFFKLKAPHHAIAGFGQFVRFERLPTWLAWEVFGEENGAASEEELRGLLAPLAETAPGRRFDRDREIGCIVIAEPVFFAPDDWVRAPDDWKSGIRSGRTYDLTAGEGRRIWRECLERAAHAATPHEWVAEAVDADRQGKPQLVVPRLGQGSFRFAVLDAYDGACAVTSEHSLPVLEAAHIKPWSEGGPHEVRNGLPLRRDLHRLFDLGFVTVRPDHSFAVSPRLREDYANGRSYYVLDGRRIGMPTDPRQRPDRELLEWHGDAVFRAG